MKVSSIESQMLIRKPAHEVYQAFVDPDITTHFWFTHSSGSLKESTTVSWEWRMYGVSVNVTTTKLLPGEKIVINWGPPNSSVEMNFKKIADDLTYVTIRHYGFQQTGDELVAGLIDSMGGFTMVLAGLKAYLEHGIELNLIGDKFPKEVANFGK